MSGRYTAAFASASSDGLVGERRESIASRLGGSSITPKTARKQPSADQIGVSPPVLETQVHGKQGGADREWTTAVKRSIGIPKRFSADYMSTATSLSLSYRCMAACPTTHWSSPSLDANRPQPHCFKSESQEVFTSTCRQRGHFRCHTDE